MKDFWCSATVRFVDSQQYSLWTERIQAPSLALARAEAIRLIERRDDPAIWQREYGQLQILWDEREPVRVVVPISRVEQTIEDAERRQLVRVG